MSTLLIDNLSNLLNGTQGDSDSPVSVTNLVHENKI